MSANWIFKVIVAGAGGVGKTALIQRDVTGTFIEDHKMTIGAAFSVKDITLDTGELVQIATLGFCRRRKISVFIRRLLQRRIQAHLYAMTLQIIQLLNKFQNG